MTTEIEDKVKGLHQKLTDSLNTVKLGTAGRLVYYDKDKNMLILAVHTTSPEKAHEATQLAWDSIPEELRAELQEANMGFAGKQIQKGVNNATNTESRSNAHPIRYNACRDSLIGDLCPDCMLKKGETKNEYVSKV